MKILPIPIPNREYNIMIEKGALSKAGELIRKSCKSTRFFIITDENVWNLYGEILKNSLISQGFTFTYMVLPSGEQSKSIDTLEKIYNQMIASDIKREDMVIVLGGGVVGDVAGFAAATYMRGVSFIQIPTTLLAQVDSSVGGKVAVNLTGGKNMAGAFYQPSLVIIDPNLLVTLCPRDFASGMAEVIKYGAILDGELLDDLQNTQGRQGIMDHIEQVVYRCCELKGQLVLEDEMDYGRRMILNFGHTFGHAIEKIGEYSRYTHGEGVAIGMVMAAGVSESLRITETPLEARLCGILKQFDLPTQIDLTFDEILSHMGNDKKNTGDEITLILLTSFGNAIIHKISKQALDSLGAGLK